MVVVVVVVVDVDVVVAATAATATANAAIIDCGRMLPFAVGFKDAAAAAASVSNSTGAVCYLCCAPEFNILVGIATFDCPMDPFVTAVTFTFEKRAIRSVGSGDVQMLLHFFSPYYLRADSPRGCIIACAP